MTTVPLTRDQLVATLPSMAPIACIMCLVPPDAQQFAVPVAQATMLVVPYVLRDRISGAIRAARDRRRPPDDIDDLDDSSSDLDGQTPSS